MGERGRRWVCATIALAVLSACSSDDDDGDVGAEQETTEVTAPSSTAPPSTEATTISTTTSPPTTTRPPTPEGQITVDYLAYWAAYQQLASDPVASADAPTLAENASGQALDSARQAIADLRTRGQRIDFGPLEKHNTYGPAVIDAQTAYVADCHVADTRLLAANGAVERSDPPGGRLETIAVTLVRSGDRWLVDSLQYYDLAPGEACSASGPEPG